MKTLLAYGKRQGKYVDYFKPFHAFLSFYYVSDAQERFTLSSGLLLENGKSVAYNVF